MKLQIILLHRDSILQQVGGYGMSAANSKRLGRLSPQMSASGPTGFMHTYRNPRSQCTIAQNRNHGMLMTCLQPACMQLYAARQTASRLAQWSLSMHGKFSKVLGQIRQQDGHGGQLECRLATLSSNVANSAGLIALGMTGMGYGTSPGGLTSKMRKAWLELG